MGHRRETAAACGIDAWIEEISRLDSQIYLLDKFAENLATGYASALAEAAK